MSLPVRLGLTVLTLIAMSGAAQAECSGDTSATAVPAAKKVVQRLYKTPAFIEARSEIDAATINALAPDLTDRLVVALREFTAALIEADASADRLTKSPLPSGPIFHSNYEGMDRFSVAGASAANDGTVHVVVDMTFSSPLGSAAWSDVAVLRCEGGGWRLDDVIFDPNQTAGPSLTSRIAVPKGKAGKGEKTAK